MIFAYIYVILCYLKYKVKYILAKLKTVEYI
jgi:hypothetical protein